MVTILKTKSKIDTNDNPPYIFLQMLRSQANSTRLNIENPR